MRQNEIREAIIKDVNDYLGEWGSMHYMQIGAAIERIVNKHFGVKDNAQRYVNVDTKR